MAGKFKYEDGYIFNSGVQLIKRNYKKGKEWKCSFKCPRCGNIFETTLHNVTSGDTKSCGCLDSENRAKFSKLNETNLVGQRFGKLVVLQKTDKRSKDGRIIYQCKCDCGKLIYVSSHNLTVGNKKSCGCLKHESGKYFIQNLQGKKFGKLTVIKDSGKRYKNNHGSAVIWLCKCECGNLKECKANDLKAGKILSCGCLSSSYYANLIEQILLNNQIKYIKEKIFNDCINPKTNYKLRFDFYLPDYNCCIEYDGKQHFKPVKQWDKNDSLEDRQYRDNIKTRYCFEHNIKLVRIPYTESLNINDKYILSRL